jgi:hypothetical protein
MGVTLAAVGLTALLQGVVLSRRLTRRVPAGPVRDDTNRWAALAGPLLAVSTFTLVLGSTDILLLKLYVGAEEIARYYAATKIVAIASFVSYGVAATSSHRFAAAAASGDRQALARVAVEAARWSFWPTLAIALILALLAQPLLGLFGPGFDAAAPIVGLLGLGLVASAAVGPADRALAMTDGAGICAFIFAGAFALNVVFCVALIPMLGPAGAAVGTGLALAAKSAMLWAITRRRLGLDTFVSPPASLSDGPAHATFRRAPSRSRSPLRPRRRGKTKPGAPLPPVPSNRTRSTRPPSRLPVSNTCPKGKVRAFCLLGEALDRIGNSSAFFRSAAPGGVFSTRSQSGAPANSW